MSEGDGTFETLGTVDELAGLVKIASERARAPDRYGWYRGHQHVSWELRPSVMRSKRAAANEGSLLTEFMTAAPPRYPRCPPQPDRFSPAAAAMWLSLARQYGLRTRLLDWSQSILVAAFFAVQPRTETDDVDGAVWVLDPVALNRLNNALKDEEGVPVLGGDPVTCALTDAALDRVPQGSSPSQPSAVATSPPQTDVRIVVQQCAYTIHCDRTPLEEFVGNVLERAVIPARAKPEIYHELRAVGIRESALFPDLEHLARELGEGPPIKD